MLRSTLQRYAAMQQLAADTMQFIQNHIQVGQTADQIKTLCETYMLAHGAQSFWYYDVGALVFITRIRCFLCPVGSMCRRIPVFSQMI